MLNCTLNQFSSISKGRDMGKVLILGIIFININLLFSQSDVNVSGGDANDQSGSVSYTVGQVFYNVNWNSAANINEGIQQPYEIYNISSVENQMHSEDLNVYPNPTNGLITLELEKFNNNNMKCNVFDLKGELILSIDLNSAKNEISLTDYPAGTYYAEIRKNNEKINTYKIIKN
jgi:hypothetical protein